MSDAINKYGLAQDYAAWWAEEVARQDLARREANHKFESMMGAMRDRGIVTITAQYDGCGDSGTVEAAKAFDAEGNEVEITDEENEAVEDAVTRNIRGDWYNNDGGFGEAVFDLRTMELTIDESYRVTEIESDVTTVLFCNNTKGDES